MFGYRTWIQDYKKVNFPCTIVHNGHDENDILLCIVENKYMRDKREMKKLSRPRIMPNHECNERD